MKKVILFIMITLTLSCFISCSNSVKEEEKEAFIFKLPDWITFKMKEGDVRSHYDDEPVSYGDIIHYSRLYFDAPYKEYESYKCSYDLYYGFSDNELILSSYVISFGREDILSSINKVEDRPYVSEYNYMKEEMISLYGEPLESTETWFDDKYKDDELMINYAIENGDYTNLTLWKLDNLYISLLLYKDIKINYTCNEDEWFYIE